VNFESINNIHIYSPGIDMEWFSSEFDLIVLQLIDGQNQVICKLV